MCVSLAHTIFELQCARVTYTSETANKERARARLKNCIAGQSGKNNGQNIYTYTCALTQTPTVQYISFPPTSATNTTSDNRQKVSNGYLQLRRKSS